MTKMNFLLAGSLLSLISLSAGETNFREQPEKYWDFSRLKNAPAYRDAPADSQVKGLRAVLVSGFGPAADDKDISGSNPQPLSAKVRSEFFACIGIPDGPVPKGGFPGVVLIHGWGGTAFPQYVFHWMKHGYAVIALDWYNQRAVPPPDFTPAPIRRIPRPGNERNAFIANTGRLENSIGKIPLPGGKRQDHVANVANIVLAHSLLRSLENVNPEKTAFIGLSWGSWYGAMVAAVDPRFKGGVEIYCGDVKANGEFTDGRFHHAAKVPLCWIAGTNDRNVTLESLKRGFEECANLENKTLVIRLPHSHVGFYFDSCLRMADHFTQGKPGLPKLSDITQKGKLVSAKILDPGKGIERAELCYTDSSEETYHKREWKSIPAKIEKGVISAELPAGTHQYFLSAYDEESGINDLCGSTLPVFLPSPDRKEKDMNRKVETIRADFCKANYDRNKIAPYTLEDPLTFLSGEKVTSSEQWKERRKEILGIFAREMFGQEPPPPECVLTELIEEKKDALAGFAIRSQYRMWFKPDKSGPCLDWLVLRPRFCANKARPILFLNYSGNHKLIPDKEVIIPEGMWCHWTRDHRVSAQRGIQCDPNRTTVLPVGMLINSGFAVMSCCYCQISPDPLCDEKEERFRQEPFAYTKIFELWGKRDESRTDNITSIGAWAWALSRGLDLAETIPGLDAKHNIVIGCSRLGKAALLAAARDERFAMCVPIQCGGGGVALAKRDFGENVAVEISKFRHWFCKAYDKYAENPAKLLTFDQHLLVAAVAPRKMLVGGFDDPWYDTEGEYLACKAASPAWKICGKSPLPDVPWPGDFDLSAIGPDIGYYRRSQKHGISFFDWLQVIRFAQHGFLQ